MDELEIEVNPAGGRLGSVPRAAPVRRPEHDENSLTRVVEHQTAKIPSDVFLFAALASMAASLLMELRGRERGSRFVGMWVGPLLIMGVYNKLVKITGPR
jgi:hypothetical protein